MKIKKDDFVQVISGADKGKRGKVLRVINKKNRVIVEGINYVHKHLKKTQQTPQGGRMQKEASIDISNIMLYCPYCEKPCKTSYKYESIEENEKDKKENKDESLKLKKTFLKARYCKICNRKI